MKKLKQVPGRTIKQRAAYFAEGRVTVGKISQFYKSSRRFVDWYVGRVRGRIITGPRGNWKFTTEAGARNAANWYKRLAQRRAGKGNNILDESSGQEGDESSLIAASKGGA